MLLLCISLVISPTNKYAKKPNNSEESSEVLYRDAILALISESIENSLVGYYGELPRYHLFNTKILDIERLEEGAFAFKLNVEVRSWRGPLPPYGLDTLKMEISPSGIRVLKFSHKDIQSLM